MTLEVLLIFIIIGGLARAIIFKKRDTKLWQAFLPVINKYKLGIMANSKKLGIINAVAFPIFVSYFTACIGFELWIMNKYSAYIQVPVDMDLDSKIIISAPDYINNIALYSKYLLIAIGLFTWIVWCMMMWKFTMIHKKNPWWIVLWATVPPIPYIYFAAIPDIAIDGKLYTMKRVEVEEKNEKKSARSSRNSRSRKRKKHVL